MCIFLILSAKVLSYFGREAFFLMLNTQIIRK
jgi:hypothetical protein